MFQTTNQINQVAANLEITESLKVQLDFWELGLLEKNRWEIPAFFCHVEMDIQRGCFRQMTGG
jgi:hypothetical protein